ncbi:hypothetical protein ACKRZS_012246 [Fusarium odoratissimum]|nr:hypothetical protein DER44DRAFT_82267 [Fusarium oxysporum]
MSHGPPPPPPPPQGAPHLNNFNNFYGFNLDIGSLPDMTGGQMGADGQDNDLMAMLDNSILGGITDIPMNTESADDSNMSGSFGNGQSTTEESVARAENQFNTAANNVPGAGPLPAGAFAQMNLAGASTLTEFTKRRNWPAKVVEELRDFLQILDANGRIKYASPSILQVTGYSVEEIQDVFLKDLIHPDDQGVFVAELNESIASGNPLRLFYRFKKKDAEYAIFETVGHAHIAGAKFAPNPNNQSPFCQAVFMMARPYPTKNAGLLDSFLEHKIENERLKRRIAELRREEEAENDEAQKQWLQSQEGRSDMTPSEGTGVSSGTFYRPVSERGMTEADRAALNKALTRENLEGSVAGGRQDSLKDKMARYEGASHTDTIEMLTGLRYIEGERSRGITTGNASPTLIKGDAGIAIPMERDPRTGDKKKKLKTSEEYVCTDCGTLDSPEWRKGPQGPKTLCNACGLRWAKREKKRTSTSHPPTVDQSV